MKFLFKQSSYLAISALFGYAALALYAGSFDISVAEGDGEGLGWFLMSSCFILFNVFEIE